MVSLGPQRLKRSRFVQVLPLLYRNWYLLAPFSLEVVFIGFISSVRCLDLSEKFLWKSVTDPRFKTRRIACEVSECDGYKGPLEFWYRRRERIRAALEKNVISLAK